MKTTLLTLMKMLETRLFPDSMSQSLLFKLQNQHCASERKFVLSLTTGEREYLKEFIALEMTFIVHDQAQEVATAWQEFAVFQLADIWVYGLCLPIESARDVGEQLYDGYEQFIKNF
ncbi:hypothetical protein N0M98_09385 [Paenibacillus doosanensis]|uniref:hypothetical protein n=1 Tax=Paenibacillus doosanensis TaxID=1229154 RepID=UPI00217FDE88|nr:hypothetical protein [Paenibacillus doosanensis]MCS7460353.1 hypothetical protein [Paenibacillus doosanensis]